MIINVINEKRMISKSCVYGPTVIWVIFHFLYDLNLQAKITISFRRNSLEANLHVKDVTKLKKELRNVSSAKSRPIENIILLASMK